MPDRPHIHVMRYMGNKQRLLPGIVRAVQQLAPPGSIVVDAMAGTHAVGYALKHKYRIVANDVQAYTEPIGKALLSHEPLHVGEVRARGDLQESFEDNCRRRQFDFFERHYSDTYFSREQCLEIDSIRFAIHRLEDQSPEDPRTALYLTALISAACLVQSTPGHFAQFLPKEHSRVQPLRAISVWDSFLKKLDKIDIAPSCGENCVYVGTWRQLLKRQEFLQQASDIGLIYVDPPYSQEQYSRFYHVLETLVLYDSPRLAFKARYRSGRFKSGFCYPQKVGLEFDALLQSLRSHTGCPVLISYSNKGLLAEDALLDICRKHFPRVQCDRTHYPHSTLGKGNVPDVMELLIRCLP